MSDATKHTTGPLVASKGFDDEPDRWVVTVDGPKQWIVAVIHNGAPGDTLDTEEAHARLFAAAPDLLAACKLALYEVGGGTKTQDFGEACRLRNEAERALRAALARAGQAVPS